MVIFPRWAVPLVIKSDIFWLQFVLKVCWIFHHDLYWYCYLKDERSKFMWHKFNMLSGYHPRKLYRFVNVIRNTIFWVCRASRPKLIQIRRLCGIPRSLMILNILLGYREIPCIRIFTPELFRDLDFIHNIMGFHDWGNQRCFVNTVNKTFNKMFHGILRIKEMAGTRLW